MDNFSDILNTFSTVLFPQIISIIKENAVLMCTVGFIIVMMYAGYRRGLMTRLISFCSVIISLIVEIRIFPYVMDALTESDGVQDFFLEIGNGILGSVTGTGVTSPLYEILGLDMLAENIGETLGTLAIKVMVFVLLFIAIRLALRLVAMLVRGLKRIHVVDIIDKLLGMALGFAESMVYVWIFMLAVSAFPNMAFCRTVLTQIARDQLLSSIYSQNLILRFIADLLH